MTTYDSYDPWTKARYTPAPENLPSQKERIVFQVAFFRGELLNFGGVPGIIMPISCLEMKVYRDFPTKNVMIMVVTGILGGGPHPIYK